MALTHEWLDLGLTDCGPNPIAVSRNGPALWETLLEAVDCKGAVVCGGAVRDYLLNLEPKDIDIFVPLGTEEELDALMERLNDTGMFQLWKLVDGGGQLEYEEAIEEIVGVLEGEAIGLPINIVARIAHQDGAWDLINSFDYGILQWSFEAADLGIVSTAQAITDLANRTATLTRNTYYRQSIERYERFNSRNPGALRLVDNYGAA